MLGVCRHHKHDQGSHLKTFPACDSFWSHNPWDKAILPQTFTSLLFSDTLFVARPQAAHVKWTGPSSTGTVLPMQPLIQGPQIRQLWWLNVAHISMLLLHRRTAAIMETYVMLLGTNRNTTVTDEFFWASLFHRGPTFLDPWSVYSVQHNNTLPLLYFIFSNYCVINFYPGWKNWIAKRGKSNQKVTVYYVVLWAFFASNSQDKKPQRKYTFETETSPFLRWKCGHRYLY